MNVDLSFLCSHCLQNTCLDFGTWRKALIYFLLSDRAGSVLKSMLTAKYKPIESWTDILT